jgi:hypothetical protein
VKLRHPAVLPAIWAKSVAAGRHDDPCIRPRRLNYLLPGSFGSVLPFSARSSGTAFAFEGAKAGTSSVGFSEAEAAATGGAGGVESEAVGFGVAADADCGVGGVVAVTGGKSLEVGLATGDVGVVGGAEVGNAAGSEANPVGAFGASDVLEGGGEAAAVGCAAIVAAASDSLADGVDFAVAVGGVAGRRVAAALVTGGATVASGGTEAVAAAAEGRSETAGRSDAPDFWLAGGCFGASSGAAARGAAGAESDSAGFFVASDVAGAGGEAADVGCAGGVAEADFAPADGAVAAA